jgi:hypothetical protein
MYKKPDGFRFIATNCGNDIYGFRSFDSHRKKLANLLNLAAAYPCECERDVELAKNLGFTGQVMPVVLNSGGFAAENLSRAGPKLSDRKIISIKR